MVIGSFITFCFYTIIQVTGSSQGYNSKEKFTLALFAPLAYVFIYILSYVEYIATIRGLLNIRKLIREYKGGGTNCSWTHVTRPA